MDKGGEDSDRVQFANLDMEEVKPDRRCWRRSRLLPLSLSILSLILIVSTVIGAAVQLNIFSNEIATMNHSAPTSRALAQTKGGNSSDPRFSEASSTEDLRVVVNQLLSERKLISQQLYALKKQVHDLQRNSDPVQQQTSGSVYTRWGKSSCPPGSELLYQGFAAGSATGYNGGGANYLCMPEEPQYNKYDAANDSLAHSWLYAVEYRTYDLKIFPDEVSFHNMACSVCRSKRTAQVVIPGHRLCPDRSWTLEYEGYLMSSYISQQKSTFICVDAEPDVIEGTFNVTGSSYLYFVSGYCPENGGLGHCPPYVDARELTCVLCTK